MDYFDVEVASAGSDSGFIRLPLMRFGTFRNMILAPPETLTEAPPQPIHPPLLLADADVSTTAAAAASSSSSSALLFFWLLPFTDTSSSGFGLLLLPLHLLMDHNSFV